MTSRRYLMVVACATMLLCGAIYALCATIDPYGLRARPAASDVDGAPGLEPAGALWRKIFSVRSIMPRTVILGTSRADRALDAHHRAFSAEDAPVLNLAFGAATIEQMRLMLVHANTVSPVRKAIIGLDLESFLGPGRTDFHPAYLEGNPYSQPAWLSRLLVDFSRGAMESAVSQLLHPGPAPGRPALEAQLRELEGQRGLVWTAEFNNFYARLQELFPPAATAYRWDSDARRRAALASFASLLAYAREHGIELRMFVSPVHARYLEWYRRVGWWPLFQDWKRELVAAIAAEAGAHPGQTRFTLWDFSGFHALATEPVPRLGDLESRMHWYLESSHYTRALGDLVLQRVLGEAASPDSPLPDARIDVRNIGSHLVRLALDAQAYRSAQRGEAQNVRAMVTYLQSIVRRAR